MLFLIKNYFGSNPVLIVQLFVFFHRYGISPNSQLNEASDGPPH